MLVNPFLLIITVIAMVIILVGCIIKNPRFPMLTFSFTVIFAIYIGFTYLINNAMFSYTDHILPDNILFAIVGFLTMSSDVSYAGLEVAFNQYAIVLIVLTCINTVVFISDIKRIFFKKQYIFKDDKSEIIK